MSSPELALSPRQGRVYVWPPDDPQVEYPSVTTIINELSKPALTNWAAKMVAEFAFDNQAAWTGRPDPKMVFDFLRENYLDTDIGQLQPDEMRVALDAGSVGGLDRDSALSLLKGAPWRDRDRKGSVGTAIHRALDSDGMVESGLEGYIDAARAFLDETGNRLRSREQTLFNDSFEYAGTVDGFLLDEAGNYSLVDWKTGKGLYADYALQMVAYLCAEWGAVQRDPSTWKRVAMPPMPNGGWVVRLAFDGSFEGRRVVVTERLWRAFVGLRSVRAWTDSSRQRWSVEVRKTPKKSR